MEKKLIILTTIITLLFGCNNSGNTEQEPVAQVFDKVLTQQEIHSVIPENVTGNDSIQFIANYINNWIKEQIIIHQAELNLKEEEKSFLGSKQIIFGIAVRVT